MKLVIIRSIFFVDSRSESALLIRRFTAVGSGSMSQPLSSDVDENRFQGPSMAKIIAAATKALFFCALSSGIFQSRLLLCRLPAFMRYAIWKRHRENRFRAVSVFLFLFAAVNLP